MQIYLIDKKSEEIKAISKIYIDSWSITYDGFVSDSYLKSLNYHDAEKKWTEFLNDTKNFIFVAKQNNEVIGFVAGCIDDENSEGELYALYVDPALKNTGIGSKLLDKFFEHMKENNITSIIVWAMSKNKNAISYYKHKGAVEYNHRMNSFDGEVVEDTALIWRQI